MLDDSNYYWVRVYDYVHERDMFEKGTKLDEFYLKDVSSGREGAKQAVKGRYCSRTSGGIRFTKPKKQTDGLYAIVMDSTKFYYDRFNAEVDTLCFWCHEPVKGKACEYPRAYIGDDYGYDSTDDVFGDLNKTAYFCKYDCKSHFHNNLRNDEGEFQVKEEGQNGNVFGYIYLIYNRAQNVYYVGQTRFMPFFRWQEHVKDGSKGEISDLSFSTLAEVMRNKHQNDEQNQLYLNSIEAWWIAKFQQERYEVFNISKPKITIEYLKNRFKDMVLKQEELMLV
jgi:hypothetical protein